MTLKGGRADKPNIGRGLTTIDPRTEIEYRQHKRSDTWPPHRKTHTLPKSLHNQNVRSRTEEPGAYRPRVGRCNAKWREKTYTSAATFNSLRGPNILSGVASHMGGSVSAFVRMRHLTGSVTRTMSACAGERNCPTSKASDHKPSGRIGTKHHPWHHLARKPQQQEEKPLLHPSELLWRCDKQQDAERGLSVKQSCSLQGDLCLHISTTRRYYTRGQPPRVASSSHRLACAEHWRIDQPTGNFTRRARMATAAPSSCDRAAHGADKPNDTSMSPQIAARGNPPLCTARCINLRGASNATATKQPLAGQPAATPLS